MINTTLIWLLLIPVVLSALSLYLAPKLSGGFVSIAQNYGIAFGGLMVSGIILYGSFYMGQGFQTADVQVINGEITGKDRIHGEYQRPYDCNCKSVQSCSGSGKNRSCSTTQKCDTCYEDRYTVKWKCDSTIGSWSIQSLDKSTRAVYMTPDPARYTLIKNGDPVSKTSNYSNYIKAVPDTLFRPAAKDLKQRYASSIPEYPSNIYDFYRIDRFVPVGVAVADAKSWNDKLSEINKTLGPRKQANAVVVMTKFGDEGYFFALQDAWLNGKKNDIVVVVGAPEFPKKAAWVRIMSMTKSDIFQVQLRDKILDLEELTADSVTKIIQEVAVAKYERRSMKEFEYLESEIDPPLWFIIAVLLVIIASYGGFWFSLHYQKNQNARIRAQYNSYRNRF